MVKNSEEFASQVKELKEMISYFNVGSSVTSKQTAKKRNETKFLHARDIKDNAKLNLPIKNGIVKLNNGKSNDQGTNIVMYEPADDGYEQF